MSSNKKHLQAVIDYYDQTRFDYNVAWLNKENLAVHFGFYDEHADKHADMHADMDKDYMFPTRAFLSFRISIAYPSE